MLEHNCSECSTQSTVFSGSWTCLVQYFLTRVVLRSLLVQLDAWGRSSQVDGRCIVVVNMMGSELRACECCVSRALAQWIPAIGGLTLRIQKCLLLI